MVNIPHGLQALLANTDRHALHLTRVLSTSEGTEATLCTLYYALALVHSRLTHLLEASYEKLAEDIVLKASKTMMPGETVVAHIEPPHVALRDSCESVKAAGDTIYSVRCFLRLWGLLRIYEKARATYVKPPRDAIIKLLVWSQIGAKTTYQFLENGAFLTSIRVLRSDKWIRREQKWWSWSNRVWLVYVALEGLRLLRVRQLRYNEEFGAEGKEHRVDLQSEALKKRWHRDFYAAAGWVAPSIYLSYADPLESPVSETWMGLSGLLTGMISFGDVWKNTA